MLGLFSARPSTASTRDLRDEQDQLSVQQGVISEADLIVRNWEKSEVLIRSTISTINDRSDFVTDYASQIRILNSETEKLIKLFDRIGEIIINEPTCCRIKQSTILGWGTSAVGAISGGAGLGTMVYNYINSSAPNLAPIILTAGGVAVVGFQMLFWNRMKQQQEDRTKLLILRGRCDVISEAREMSRVLQKITRLGAKMHLSGPMMRSASSDSGSSSAAARESEEVGPNPAEVARFHDLLGQVRKVKDKITTQHPVDLSATASATASRVTVTFRGVASETESETAAPAPLASKSGKYTTQSLLQASAVRFPSLMESFSHSGDAPHVVLHVGEHAVAGVGLTAGHLLSSTHSRRGSLSLADSATGRPKSLDAASRASSEDAVDIFGEEKGKALAGGAASALAEGEV